MGELEKVVESCDIEFSIKPWMVNGRLTRTVCLSKKGTAASEGTLVLNMLCYQQRAARYSVIAPRPIAGVDISCQGVLEGLFRSVKVHQTC